jgi:hypothetical protein
MNGGAQSGAASGYATYPGGHFAAQFSVGHFIAHGEQVVARGIKLHGIVPWMASVVEGCDASATWVGRVRTVASGVGRAHSHHPSHDLWVAGNQLVGTDARKRAWSVIVSAWEEAGRIRGLASEHGHKGSTIYVIDLFEGGRLAALDGVDDHPAS